MEPYRLLYTHDFGVGFQRLDSKIGITVERDTRQEILDLSVILLSRRTTSYPVIIHWITGPDLFMIFRAEVEKHYREKADRPSWAKELTLLEF